MGPSDRGWDPPPPSLPLSLQKIEMGWPDGRLLPIICFRTEQLQLSITESTILAMKCCGPFYTKQKLNNLSLKQKYHLMDQSIKLTELIETVKFHRNPSQTLKFRNYMKSPILCDCSIYKGTNIRAILIPSLRKHQFLLALRRWGRFAHV